MAINVFCLCALALFVVTLGQNPEENKDLTPRELLKNTHTQHEHFAKTMMLPLLEKLTKTPTLMSKIQSKGMAMKASHGTESEFHLNYEKIRSNIASMKVKHSAKSEFELKPNFPSASVAKSSAAQIADSSSADTTPNTTPKPKEDVSSSTENDDSTKRSDTNPSEKANETSKPKTESFSSETKNMQSNKNANKSSEPKSKNSSSEKADKTSTPMKSSSSKKDTSPSVEKNDSLSQVNNSPHKHTLHIVITHVFHSSLPQGARIFDVAIPVQTTDYDTNLPYVRTSKQFKSNTNFKEASRGMNKVSMACIINKK